MTTQTDTTTTGTTTTGAAATATATGGAPPATPAPPVAGTPPAGAPPGQAAGGNAPPDGSAYRPEGIAEGMVGKSDRETIDNLMKSLKGFRDAQAKMEPLPADAAGYKVEWSETVKPYAQDLDGDGFWTGVREDALSVGLPASKFGAFIDKVMQRMVGAGALEAPVDIEAEKAKLAPAEARGLPPAERDAAIQRRVATNIAFVDSLAAKGLPAETVKSLQAELAAYPELNALVEFMRNGDVQAPATGGQPPGQISEADLRARMADPKNRVASRDYDATFAAETTRLYKAFYGDGNAG